MHRYLAPEVLLGECCYCGAIDVWSIACVMCEMVFGKPFFPGVHMTMSNDQGHGPHVQPALQI